MLKDTAHLRVGTSYSDQSSVLRAGWVMLLVQRTFVSHANPLYIDQDQSSEHFPSTIPSIKLHVLEALHTLVYVPCSYPLHCCAHRLQYRLCYYSSLGCQPLAWDGTLGLISQKSIPAEDHLRTGQHVSWPVCTCSPLIFYRGCCVLGDF